MAEYEEMTWGERLRGYNSVRLKLISGEEVSGNINSCGIDYCELIVDWKKNSEHCELYHKDKILAVISD
ncbi:MAG: hypothetical protein NG737_06000 [Omnitrophica bacterium]|nr:hypothetical protein [Candidatus Omnitrophota bacterium]